MKAIPSIVAVVFLGLSTTVNAEPVRLTDAQLDQTVAAGTDSGSPCCGSSGFLYNFLNNNLSNNKVAVLSGNQILSGIGILGVGTAGNGFGL
ncbi:MAG: hypothetical protein HZB57_00890 [Gammaproteobacteria bacterium]|nr:hypothetical protein [Gammaproteobacteria bacterium]